MVKRDLICAGVGGQGVLSISAIIAASAMRVGLHVKQSEEHGMAQRGGAVVSHLRISSEPIHSDLVAHGGADLLISMEPLEGLRYVEFLAADGTLLTSTEPVRNIPNYPELNEILERIRALPGAQLIDAAGLAREAGSLRASNMVMVGAASHSLGIDPSAIEAYIREAFLGKGSKVVEINLKAFQAGREAVGCPV